MHAAPRNRSRANHDVTEDDYQSLLADWKKSLPGTMADAVGPVLCSNTCQVTPVTFMRLHQLFTLLLKYGLTSGVLLTSHLQSGLQKTMPEGTSLVDITKYRDHIQHNFTMLRWYSQHSSKASAFKNRLSPTDKVLVNSLAIKTSATDESDVSCSPAPSPIVGPVQAAPSPKTPVRQPRSPRTPPRDSILSGIKSPPPTNARHQHRRGRSADRKASETPSPTVSQQSPLFPSSPDDFDDDGWSTVFSNYVEKNPVLRTPARSASTNYYSDHNPVLRSRTPRRRKESPQERDSSAASTVAYPAGSLRVGRIPIARTKTRKKLMQQMKSGKGRGRSNTPTGRGEAHGERETGSKKTRAASAPTPKSKPKTDLAKSKAASTPTGKGSWLTSKGGKPKGASRGKQDRSSTSTGSKSKANLETTTPRKRKLKDPYLCGPTKEVMPRCELCAKDVKTGKKIFLAALFQGGWAGDKFMEVGRLLERAAKDGRIDCRIHAKKMCDDIRAEFKAKAAA